MVCVYMCVCACVHVHDCRQLVLVLSFHQVWSGIKLRSPGLAANALTQLAVSLALAGHS